MTPPSKPRSAPEGARKYILVIEDDQRVATGLMRGLTENGFSVRAVATLKEAKQVIAAIAPRLVILDLGLPDGDGLVFLRDSRRFGASWPVIILTARDSIEARVAGLDEGADDYLVKPFSFPELLARVRARLRNVR